MPRRLQPHRRHYWLERYFLWAFTETPFGRWRREHIVDPLLYLRRRVHWRNYEAGYDVAELEPPTRRYRTWVLQEYFVPVERLYDFVPRMAEILQRHRVNILNISIRHASADPGSLLAWARQETFAFVLYYKQRTRENARQRVAVWTRELIDAALDCGGTYYLPYQVHATGEQFHRAYPRAKELFALKRRLDPDFRFRNVLWDEYYAPTLAPAASEVAEPHVSEFKAVYGDTRWRDAFYRFLQNVYRIYPEDRFHTAIIEACRVHDDDDESIYRAVQQALPTIKPLLADLTYAVPSLARQKAEMTRQTLEVLGERRVFDGYVEIGSTGRYLSRLRRKLSLGGDLVLINDVAPTSSPVDIVERGGLARIGRFVALRDYAPFEERELPSAAYDLVTCYIGLHHVDPAGLPAFVRSVARTLRPGGIFILRDHDVKTPEMHAFVSLAHAVFNAGLGVPWQENSEERRHFAPVERWVSLLDEAGLRDLGQRKLQVHDPTDNVLMAFEKQTP